MFKKSVVIRARRHNKPKLKLSYQTIIFFTILLCGVIFGAILSSKGSVAWHTFFNTFVNNHLTVKASSSLFRNFCSVFFSLFLIILFDYICGLCGLGIPFIYSTPFLLGTYCGVIISQFYYLYHIKGLVYCIAINIPCYAIAAATLIKCCCFSTDISKEILVYLINGKNDTNEKLLYNYSLKYLLLCIPLVMSAFLNALSFRLFSDLFNFI